MQSRLEKQEKLYYRNKVSDIISEYEKQKEEQDRQKVLMKKQIMQTILSNRQKTNPSHEPSLTSKEKTFKTNISEEHFDDPNPPHTQQPHSNPDSRYQSQLNRFEEVTFNAKKRNKSLEEELTFKESYLSLLKERRQKEEEELEELGEEHQQQGLNSYPIQKSTYKSFREEEGQQQAPSRQPNFSKYKESQSHAKPYTEKSDQSEGNRSGEEMVEVEQEQQRGVFLTMGESESMVAEEPLKNITFEIKMDKSMSPDNLEELKRLKIKDIERKRQERIEEFRRNQSQKKVEMPKGKNSYSRKAIKDQFNESEIPPPRSVTVERKNPNPSVPVQPEPRKKEVKVEHPQPISKHLIPLQSHESQYSIKPNNSRHPPCQQQQLKPPSYKQIHHEEREVKAVSPFRTPKSILSENRGKSSGKGGSIFAVEGEGREKSSNKCSEPKIEPKDRKNSFTRQSNKKLMVNAITHVIFPGELNRKERERLIEIIEASQYEFFIFLFKEYSRKMIKGIYVFDSTQTYLRKIYGDKSPPEITPDMVQEFYRFDSGSREFKKVDGCRSFSLSIHAIDLRK